MAMLLSCSSLSGKEKPEHSDVGFMFDENAVKHFSFPFEDESRRVVELLIKHSDAEGEQLIGVSRFILGHHPTLYVLYFEERAVVNFFYWGRNVGKGYIDYDKRAPYRMVEEFEVRGLCGVFGEVAESIWGFHVSKRSDGNWLICNEPFYLPAINGDDKEPAVSQLPFIAEYFDKHFWEGVVWNHYTYGK